MLITEKGMIPVAFYQDGKAVFAKAMVRLVDRMGLDSITVNDIVAEASASRTTFYRYFKDKNDLLAYVYTKMASDLVSHAEKKRKSNYDLSLDIINYIASKPNFFRKAFSGYGQNSFFEAYSDYTYQVFERWIKTAIVDAPEELLLTARAYAYGSCTIVKEWALCGFKQAPEVIARACDMACPSGFSAYLLGGE